MSYLRELRLNALRDKADAGCKGKCTNDRPCTNCRALVEYAVIIASGRA